MAKVVDKVAQARRHLDCRNCRVKAGEKCLDLRVPDHGKPRPMMGVHRERLEDLQEIRASS